MRAETFEIRWHDTQPIYSCSFQPVPPAHLRRVLEHNRAQAAGLEPGKILADNGDGAGPSGSTKTTASGSTLTPASATASTPSRHAAIPLSAQGQSWRFATAGGDNHARIWLVHPNIPSPAALAAAAQVSGPGPVAMHPPRVEYRATLRRHSGVVNCVRFSPKEELLATTGDDGMVLLWIPSDGPPSSFGSNLDDDNDAEFAKEHWRLRTMSRASSSEVYDMAWSPNGDALVIGGTDFVARIVNANDGTVIREISEHNHYIQGVAWDPLCEFIATQSSDRSVHVHQLLGKAIHELGNVQIASRNNKMDVTHRRNASSGGQFVWDHMAKPSIKRRASSHASDSERERDASSARPGISSKRSHRSSTPLDNAATANVGAASSSSTSNTNAPPPAVVPTPTSASSSTTGAPIGRAATPTQNQSPAAAAQQHSMNPPQRTPSRRSSFSGSQVGSPPTSATSLAPSHPPSIIGGHAAAAAAGSGGGVAGAGGGSTPMKTLVAEPQGSASRSVSRSRAFTPRSPSPAPPLPAIRAPPSPKQRLAVLQAANAGPMARLGMRMYGDEGSTGFFRRLCFSPDGALLVTPTGIFESTSAPVTGNVMQSPASPTVATIGRDAVSPSSPLLPNLSATQSRETSAAAAAARNTVYMYARGNLHRSNAPVAHLPGHKTATLVVKFSPILYELRKIGSNGGKSGHDDEGILPHPTVPLEAGKQKTVALSSAASAAGGIASSSSVQDNDGDTNLETSHTAAAEELAAAPTPSPASAGKTSTSPPNSMIGLPYRMIFAVATHDSVWIYDTQQGGPLCCFSNMHYASFTDLTWSPDGQTLMMCSTDGYCSIVVFDYGELGTPYAYASQPALQQQHQTTASAPAGAPKHSGSPMMRRASAQSLSGQQHATPPSMLSHQFGSGSGGAGSAFSPSMGLGLVAEADAKDDIEIDPPVIPSHESGSSSMPANAGTITGQGDRDWEQQQQQQQQQQPQQQQQQPQQQQQQPQQQQQRKKRRIAPTLQGPIGS